MIKRAVLFLLILFLSISFSLAEDITKAYLVGGKSDVGQEIQYLEKAISVSPDNFATYYALGVAYYRKGDFDKVIECYNEHFQFRQTDYKEAARRIEMAKRGEIPYVSYLAHPDIDKEIEALSEALKIVPRFVHFYAHLVGLSTPPSSQLNEEIEYLNQAAEVNPKNFGTYYALGVAYYRKGEYEKALQCLRIFEQLNPACALSYYGLGVTYYKTGHIDKAVGLARTLRGLGRDDLAKDLEEVVGVSFQQGREVPSGIFNR